MIWEKTKVFILGRSPGMGVGNMVKIDVDVEISFFILKNLLHWGISYSSCRRAGILNRSVTMNPMSNTSSIPHLISERTETSFII
jgi:hypothetical protein